MNKKEEKNNSKLTGIVIFINVILFIAGIALVKESFIKDSKTTPSLYVYEAKKSSTYLVYLKENKFYDNNILSSGKQYPSQLIDKMAIDLKYHLKGDKSANIDYKYNVVADIVGTSRGESASTNNASHEVWRKSYTLVNTKTDSINSSDTLDIIENLNINYNYFNNLAAMFKATYNLNMDTTLIIKLNIEYNIKVNNHDKLVNDFIQVEIPLNDSITEVKNSYDDVTVGDITDSNNKIIKSSINFIQLGIGSILILGTIIIVVYIVRKQNKSTENLYKRNINSILKEYSDLVVTVINKPDVTNLKVMKLALFDDLIDAAEQNQVNIIHYETIKNQESLLLVIAHGYVYIYEVNSDSIRRKSN